MSFRAFRGRKIRQRQSQREVAPAALASLICDLAAVLVREPLREREAEAAALDAARKRIVRSVEGLENFPLLAVVDAAAAVEHAHADVRAVEVAVQLHVLALAGVFLGVGKKVDQNLRERVFIAGDGIRRGRGFPSAWKSRIVW